MIASASRNYQGFLVRLRGRLAYREDGIYYSNPFSPARTPEVVDY
jgi:hypothetical protein